MADGGSPRGRLRRSFRLKQNPDKREPAKREPAKADASAPPKPADHSDEWEFAVSKNHRTRTRAPGPAQTIEPLPARAPSTEAVTCRC